MRIAARSLAAAGAIALAACAPDPIRIPLPELDPATRSVVVVIERQVAAEPPSIVRVSATPIPVDGSARLDWSIAELEADHRAQVILLEYTTALERLGLPAGEIARASGTAGSRLLPKADAMRFATVDDTRVSAFERLTALDAELLSFRTPGEEPCAAFRAETIPLDSTGGLGFGMQLRDGSAIVSTADGRSGAADRGLFQVFPNGSILRHPLPDEEPVFLGGVEGPDGRLYLSEDTTREAPDSRIWQGRFAPGGALILEALTATRAPGRVEWMEASRSPDEPFELYVLDDGGNLARFEPATGRFTVLHTFVGLPERGDGLGAVLRVGPGDLYAVKGNSDEVVHVIGDRVEVSMPAGESPIGFTALADLPGLGVVAAHGRGRFFALGERGWRDLGDSLFALTANVLAAYEEGFVYSGTRGYLGQYLRASERFCEPVILAPDVVYGIAVMGSDVLLINSKAQVQETFALTMARRVF